ncbi:hypothetical protein OG478_13105 [Streptomyces phaeochromogenes]|uniref:hypothetical protein n=1 Tax=Streptomyces phaeochromogenes TaxID=1923 RepID=UPI00386E1F42|nr:hypothetical protein OG478_13105 [Streptomyces phaeochromogenes]
MMVLSKPRDGRSKYFQLAPINDCTRLHVLRIYPTLNQTPAIQFLDYVLQHPPFQAEVIQTNNGIELQLAVHRYSLDKGTAHTYIKTHTPRLNGEVEHSHLVQLKHGPPSGPASLALS